MEQGDHNVQELSYEQQRARQAQRQTWIKSCVVHDDAVRAHIRAEIGPDFAIVEAIQVDALAVDGGEAVARVSGLVDVAGGVDGHRNGAAFE